MGGNARWYCYDCDTYGGGMPNKMSIEEHIDYAHDGGIVAIEETNKQV